MSVMGLTQDFGHPVLVELPRIALTKTVPPAWDETLVGCNTSPDANLIGLNKQDRWQNVLLGQTVTLALNIRFDAYPRRRPARSRAGAAGASLAVLLRNGPMRSTMNLNPESL